MSRRPVPNVKFLAPFDTLTPPYSELRDVPVLMLTSYDHLEADALAAGATSVCVKPCAPDKLLEQIRTLMLKASRHH